jgi:Domain of unknown function (DUF4263)
MLIRVAQNRLNFMKVLDIIHNFSDGNVRPGRGLCRVRSFAGDSGMVVLLTDLGELNDGQSVTNAVESIVESLVRQGYVIMPATFIEHYERLNAQSDTFDKVTLLPATRWQTLDRLAVLELIGGDATELGDRSSKNKRIFAQADHYRYRRNPFVDSRHPEPNAVVKRRLEIEAGMVSKASIDALIQAGAGEQKLQQLLKSDLSFFGEAYAKPDDEYICFSEYPLADGLIDFVIFTGRSRMDIILIEVKGAEFNLLNSNHYGAFNHKVTEAATQIQNRLGIIFRDLNTFRKDAHARRIRVERGEKLHNAFVGPYQQLQVDPNKDINIRSVVVGGRTINDLEESRKRQDYEARSTPSVRIESWDSWLRRLQRP